MPAPAHVLALLAILLDVGAFSAAELRGATEAVEMWGVAAEGAQLVVKAWLDPAFKARLLADAAAAAVEAGIDVAHRSGPPWAVKRS